MGHTLRSTILVTAAACLLATLTLIRTEELAPAAEAVSVPA